MAAVHTSGGVAPVWSADAELVAAAAFGAAAGGASRQGIAAAVAAACRCSGRTVQGGSDDGDMGDMEHVAVPREVAHEMPVIATSLAAQRIVAAATGKPCRSGADAYVEARQRVSPATATALRAVNRDRNAAFHGKTRGGRPKLLSDLRLDLASGVDSRDTAAETDSTASSAGSRDGPAETSAAKAECEEEDDVEVQHLGVEARVPTGPSGKGGIGCGSPRRAGPSPAQTALVRKGGIGCGRGRPCIAGISAVALGVAKVAELEMLRGVIDAWVIVAFDAAAARARLAAEDAERRCAELQLQAAMARAKARAKEQADAD